MNRLDLEAHGLAHAPEDPEYRRFEEAKRRLPALTSIQMGKEVAQLRDSKYLPLLKREAVAILHSKAKAATDAQLDALLNYEGVPDFALGVAIAEKERRKEAKAMQLEELAREKEQRTVSRTKPSKNPDKWLAPCKHASIFKIKWQFAEPILHKGLWVHWEETRFSKDYQSERKLMDTKSPEWEWKQRQIEDLGADCWKLFDGSDPRSFKKAGFSSFTYNAKQGQQMIDSGRVCFFAIYLNHVVEQQPNGEFWCMELWARGQRKPKVVGVEPTEDGDEYDIDF